MLKGKAGFSVPEFLIAMLVGLVVLGAVYSLFTMQNKQFSNQEQMIEMQQNARIAMAIMIREISMAGYNQTSSSCPSPVTAVPRCTGTTTATNTPCVGITYAGANTISFVTDLNANCDTTAGTANPDENITFDLYSPSGVPTLGRTSNGVKQPVVEYVDALSFTYYDGSGNVTTNVANIRRIKISITIRTAKTDPNYIHPTYNDHYRRYQLESFVVPRNLGAYTSASATTPATTTTVQLRLLPVAARSYKRT